MCIVFNTRLASSASKRTLVKGWALDLTLLRSLSDIIGPDRWSHSLDSVYLSTALDVLGITKIRKHSSVHKNGRHYYQTALVLKCLQSALESHRRVHRLSQEDALSSSSEQQASSTRGPHPVLLPEGTSLTVTAWLAGGCPLRWHLPRPSMNSPSLLLSHCYTVVYWGHLVPKPVVKSSGSFANTWPDLVAWNWAWWQYSDKYCKPELNC